MFACFNDASRRGYRLQDRIDFPYQILNHFVELRMCSQHIVFFFWQEVYGIVLQALLKYHVQDIRHDQDTGHATQ